MYIPFLSFTHLSLLYPLPLTLHLFLLYHSLYSLYFASPLLLSPLSLSRFLCLCTSTSWIVFLHIAAAINRLSCGSSSTEHTSGQEQGDARGQGRGWHCITSTVTAGRGFSLALFDCVALGMGRSSLTVPSPAYLNWDWDLGPRPAQGVSWATTGLDLDSG